MTMALERQVGEPKGSLIECLGATWPDLGQVAVEITVVVLLARR